MDNESINEWVKHSDGYHHSLLSFPYIIEPIKVTAHKLHQDKYPT